MVRSNWLLKSGNMKLTAHRQWQKDLIQRACAASEEEKPLFIPPELSRPISAILLLCNISNRSGSYSTPEPLEISGYLRSAAEVRRSCDEIAGQNFYKRCRNPGI
jgi:hypothetical protein